MKRPLLLMLLGLLLLLTAVPAVAQRRDRPRGKPKLQFYRFDDLVVDGEFRRPSVVLTTARAKARFQRLLRFRKSFLPRMMKTARYPELKAVPR